MEQLDRNIPEAYQFHGTANRLAEVETLFGIHF